MEINTTVKISGHVKITNGDTVIEGKNKLTAKFLMNIINGMAAHNTTGNQTMQYGAWDLTKQYVTVGTDTTTVTSNSTTGLAAQIGAPTKCSSLTGVTWTSSNDFFLQYMATFNPGSITGTVGEIGLYMYMADALLAAGGQYAVSGDRLAARYAVADGEFVAFTIDTSKPVIIVWTLKFTTDLKMLNQGCAGVANWVCSTGNNGQASRGMAYDWVSGKSTYMVIGSDTTHVNTSSMTALTSPIGTAPGTKAGTQSFSTTTVSAGVYKVTYTSTWAAGAVSGTVGEIGLYLNTPNVAFQGMTTWGTSTSTPATYALYARLTHADGHFSSFAIDTGKNLTISWAITFTWA